VLRETVGSDVLPRACPAVKRAEAARFAGASLPAEAGPVLTFDFALMK
jgi:hypothetical protein